jgi:hypothetical protein
MAVIQDSLNNNTLTVNSEGAANVILSSRLQTFSAISVGLVPAATATDIFVIQGSATSTVKVWGFEITGTATASAVTNIYFVKRSTANNGGTSSTLTATSFDSQNTGYSAVIKSYTANPTTGTSAGNIAFYPYNVQATGSSPDKLVVSFGSSLISQAVVLRGIAESLAVNLNGATLAGNSFNITVLFSEE